MMAIIKNGENAPISMPPTIINSFRIFKIATKCATILLFLLVIDSDWLPSFFSRNISVVVIPKENMIDDSRK